MQEQCEKFTNQLIIELQPNDETEEKRNRVIADVKNIIRCRTGREVFLFGSCAFKTYLPDGDIDLFMVVPCVPEQNPNTFVEALMNAKSEFESHWRLSDDEISLVLGAEVKVLKLSCRDIYLDLSVNQLGGLTTLCFLIEVDNFFGCDHLFKRTLVLTKAWCYYEGRIMGAACNLLGTYALTVMLIAVFNLHTNINTPLEAFAKFLKYFSEFQFEHHIVCMYGPIPTAKLPPQSSTYFHDGRRSSVGSMDSDTVPTYVKLNNINRPQHRIPRKLLKEWREKYGEKGVKLLMPGVGNSTATTTTGSQGRHMNYAQPYLPSATQLTGLPSLPNLTIDPTRPIPPPFASSEPKDEIAAVEDSSRASEISSEDGGSSVGADSSAAASSPVTTTSQFGILPNEAQQQQNMQSGGFVPAETEEDDDEELSTSFPIKHFNIVDPLRPQNNLSRGVNKKSCLRLRAVFTKAITDLERILQTTQEVPKFRSCGTQTEPRTPRTANSPSPNPSTPVSKDPPSSPPGSVRVAGKTRDNNLPDSVDIDNLETFPPLSSISPTTKDKDEKEEEHKAGNGRKGRAHATPPKMVIHQLDTNSPSSKENIASQNHDSGVQQPSSNPGTPTPPTITTASSPACALLDTSIGSANSISCEVQTEGEETEQPDIQVTATTPTTTTATGGGSGDTMATPATTPSPTDLLLPQTTKLLPVHASICCAMGIGPNNLGYGGEWGKEQRIPPDIEHFFRAVRRACYRLRETIWWEKNAISQHPDLHLLGEEGGGGPIAIEDSLFSRMTECHGSSNSSSGYQSGYYTSQQGYTQQQATNAHYLSLLQQQASLQSQRSVELNPNLESAREWLDTALGIMSNTQTVPITPTSTVSTPTHSTTSPTQYGTTHNSYFQQAASYYHHPPYGGVVNPPYAPIPGVFNTIATPSINSSGQSNSGSRQNSNKNSKGKQQNQRHGQKQYGRGGNNRNNGGGGRNQHYHMATSNTNSHNQPQNPNSNTANGGTNGSTTPFPYAYYTTTPPSYRFMYQQPHQPVPQVYPVAPSAAAAGVAATTTGGSSTTTLYMQPGLPLQPHHASSNGGGGNSGGGNNSTNNGNGRGHSPPPAASTNGSSSNKKGGVSNAPTTSTPNPPNSSTTNTNNTSPIPQGTIVGLTAPQSYNTFNGGGGGPNGATTGGGGYVPETYDSSPPEPANGSTANHQQNTPAAVLPLLQEVSQQQDNSNLIAKSGTQQQ